MLKIEGKFEVNHVNPRKEAHGEDKILAADVKVTGFCPLSQLYVILGLEAAKEARGTLWTTHESADVTLPNLSLVKPHADTKFEGLLATINGIKISDVTAKKFQFDPVAGGGELTCTLSVPHPYGKTVGALSELIGETVTVKIEPMQEGIDFGGDENAA